jgi:hypothetical protein
MAGAIIFLVIVQRKASVSDGQTFQFEAAKSLLATGLWLWLILDSAFGPWQRDWNYPREERSRRVVRSAFASILLL